MGSMMAHSALADLLGSLDAGAEGVSIPEALHYDSLEGAVLWDN